MRRALSRGFVIGGGRFGPETQGGARRLACPGLLSVAPLGLYLAASAAAKAMADRSPEGV
jgi:hypothetical protein